MATEEVQRTEKRPLDTAIEAVKDDPADAARWEKVEELLETDQRPTDVSALFKRVLDDGLEPEQVTTIGQRGVRFFETWYGEDSGGLPELLNRVLALDPSAQWAFERLTVAYTVAERWDELLDAYDSAIEAADQTARRMQLLDEAAQAAKDFANQPDRAIGYMQQLYALDAGNNTLAAALERLLERQERWQDLVALWGSRLDVQSSKQARETRVRMANCYLDKIGQPAEALEHAKRVLQDAPEYAPALALLERVLQDERAGGEQRREALELLKQHFIRKKKRKEVVRVLEAGLACAAGADQRALLRELVERLCDLGDDARALQHQAALLVLEPMPSERDALKVLAERTRDHESHARALVAAAEACPQPQVAVELLMEAARTREQTLGDTEGAIELYRRVFRADADGAAPTPAVAPVVTEAGRQLGRLLEATDRERETLDVLSRMSELEPEEAVRRTLLGKVARLAEKLGESERAQQAWQARVGDDTTDVEALDALIDAAEAAEDWERLAGLLLTRIKAPAAAERRRQDMVRLAAVQAEQLGRLDRAIKVWQGVQSSFGEDRETLAALTDLLSRAERWEELTAVLQRAAERQTARFTELQARLGDAFRERLDKAEQAAECYRSALQVDPTHEAARAGQQALLDDARCRVIAIESLAEAYAQTDEGQHTLELLEPRLSVESSESARAELLIEAAELHEQQQNDPARALSCLARAFALIPDDRATEKEIRRLAERLDAWDAVVQAYRDTIASFEQPAPRVAELRFDEGRTLEQRLSDDEGALAAYAAAAAISPERAEFAEASARLAAQLGRYAQAAEVALACMRAQGAPNEALLATLERAAAEGEGWDALSAAMSEALDESEDLPAALLRQLHARIASWHLDRREDEDAAELALGRAVAADNSDRETVKALCVLQRRAPGEALVDSLVLLFEDDEQDLDPLLEASEIAAGLSDAAPGRARELDRRLFDAAERLLLRGIETRGEASAAQCADRALERLVQAACEAGQYRPAMELLLRAADLPIDRLLTRDYRHKAARIAAHDLKDNLRAIALYRDLWQLDPNDEAALSALGELYQAEDRLPELLMLRRHQLERASDEDQRLSLRLSIASILTEMEARGGRLQTLEQNLRARPGHEPTIEAVTKLLSEQARYKELAALLERQAEQLRAHEPERALSLWRRAAHLLEHELGDLDGAVRVYRALHELEPEGDASEALARIFGGRGRHAEAARWLELRLGTAPPETRAVTAVELARAHLQAGHRERARGCLEQALREQPALVEARSLLSSIYRQDEAWEPMARLLVDSARQETDAGKRLSLLTEAADLYYETLQAPERAVEALEQASELSPEDGALHLRLAEALRRARRPQEAQAVLERLIAGFGRKRSPERAELHFQLARVLRDAGDAGAAFEQLEAATKMDMGHAAAMHMLAQLSQEQGDLDRAERAYRGLLLLVRRQQGDESEVGPAEVSFELSRIAVQRGQQDQADELLESAMEAALQGDAEARRFQRTLRERGEVELLMRLLDARLSQSQDASSEAEILLAKADVLSEALGRPDEALEAVLRGLRLDPQRAALHDSARALAAKTRELDRYLDAVSGLADEAMRKKGKRHRQQAAYLNLRLGHVIEQQLGDLDRAAGLYAKVEASGELVIDAWMAMARVSGARGDRAEQRRVLAHIGELGSDAVSTEQRRAALLALAEVELAEAELFEEGVATLHKALEADADAEPVKALLRDAIARQPGHAELEALFERVARDQQDDSMLIEHFERLSASGAPAGQVREGVELASRLGERARAEGMLERAAAQLRGGEQAKDAGWVLAGLSDCRRRAGDMQGAMAFLSEAVELAQSAEAETLARELAELAAGEAGDLELAARTYERLLDASPGDRGLWEPLLEVYRRIGDGQRFQGFVERCLESSLGSRDRASLHLAQARFLMEVAGRERDAVPALCRLLDEAPGHAEATDLLTAIYQKNEMNAELAELLRSQFDRARDEQNVEAVCELGLRLGELFGEQQRQEAIDAYRAALEWAPEHAGLLRALLARLEPDAEPRDRAEVMHALLRSAEGDEAAQLALQLVPLWRELLEPDRALEALQLGVTRCPERDELQEQLAALYAEQEMWRPLAELLTAQAERLGGSAGVGRLKNAAVLYRDHLEDLEAAAGALRKALEIVPEDLSLLGELARNLAAAGQQAQAIEDVNRLLSAHPQADAGRVDLLKVRADLHLGLERLVEAVADLEEGYAIAQRETGAALIEALERLKTSAFTTGDTQTERKVVMRLVTLHEERGHAEAAREVLADWVEQDASDVEALHELRRRDEAAERWEAVAASCERLLEVERGEARANTAIALADALQKAGRSEEARAGLERVQREDPGHAEVRERLRALYEAIGAHIELAEILIADAQAATDETEQVSLYQRAAQLYLEMDDAPSALGPLNEASQRSPDDEQTRLLLIDIYTRLGRLDEATQTLEAAIEAHGRRRSPELAVLLQRMSRVLAMKGDSDGQLKYLSQALETDRKSGEIASELAETAIALTQYDAAMKALRSITMMDDPKPITRAVAFLKQAQIAQVRGDPRRAQHWARKAKSLDENLIEADAFLAELDS